MKACEALYRNHKFNLSSVSSAGHISCESWPVPDMRCIHAKGVCAIERFAIIVRCGEAEVTPFPRVGPAWHIRWRFSPPKISWSSRRLRAVSPNTIYDAVMSNWDRWLDLNAQKWSQVSATALVEINLRYMRSYFSLRCFYWYLCWVSSNP